MFLFISHRYCSVSFELQFFDSSIKIVFAVQKVMREGTWTKLGNSSSEKQNQAVMRTEVDEKTVDKESRTERHVAKEQDWAFEDSQCHFLISSFAWHWYQAQKRCYLIGNDICLNRMYFLGKRSLMNTYTY